MKNLVAYDEDCFSIHKEAVERKTTADLKMRLEALNSLVEDQFAIYLDKFRANDLASVIASVELGKSKDDLISLYDYKSFVVRSVRESITKLQIKTIISTCQNCTINAVNTLDHLLPKTQFPEFSVNPKNLFPCCSECNSYKTTSITSRFLNLYLDNLPEEQYLFLDVSLNAKKELDFKYYLKNNGGIDTTVFSVIESHFLNLKLLKRMKFKAIEHLSELETRIITFRNLLTLNDIFSNLSDAVYGDMLSYGSNHWKCILEISLLNSKLFYSYIEERIKSLN